MLLVMVITYKIIFDIVKPSLKAKKLKMNNVNKHINPNFKPSNQPLFELFFPNKNPPIKKDKNGIIYENIFTKLKLNNPI